MVVWDWLFGNARHAQGTPRPFWQKAGRLKFGRAVFSTWPCLLVIVKLYLGKVGALREGVEYPVLLVIHVVNACKQINLLGKPIFCHQVSHYITRDSSIGKPVRVRIVQLPELLAAVTQAS